MYVSIYGSVRVLYVLIYNLGVLEESGIYIYARTICLPSGLSALPYSAYLIISIYITRCLSPKEKKKKNSQRALQRHTRIIKPSRSPSSGLKLSLVCNEMSRKEVLKAYKSLIKYGLRAVNYSQPQSSVFLKIVRNRFRENDSPTDFTPINNTVEFIHHANNYGGMENRILNQILHVEYSKGKSASAEPDDVYKGYRETVSALNVTMNLAL